MREESRSRHIGYSFRLVARVLLYASSHRQDNTYHSLCYTSRGTLAGTRNSSMGPPHEGSIRRPIAPWANALTTELQVYKFWWQYIKFQKKLLRPNIIISFYLIKLNINTKLPWFLYRWPGHGYWTAINFMCEKKKIELWNMVTRFFSSLWKAKFWYLEVKLNLRLACLEMSSWNERKYLI